MIKIVISPAKSLDFESELPTKNYTQGVFLEDAEKIQKTLKKKSPKKLKALMDISDNLAELNYNRNQEWHLPFDSNNARPAIYAFNGEVYTGLDAYTISLDKIEFLQDKLRILSGLYGILKPLDLIQPYRLEMGTQIKIGRKDNLYQYWGDRITKEINQELEGGVLINLASNEYFKVLQPKKIKGTIITPEFKDYKNGKLKMISFFAKKETG